MLNLTLGSGIAVGSLFFGISGATVVYIRAYFNNLNQLTTSSKSGANGSGVYSHNGHVRKGEHDESIRSLHQRLDDIHEENKNWWKQLDGKIDKFVDDLNKSMNEQQTVNRDLHERVTSIETAQKLETKKN